MLRQRNLSIFFDRHCCFFRSLCSPVSLTLLQRSNPLKHQSFTQNLQVTDVLFIAPDRSRSLPIAPPCPLIGNILHSNSHTLDTHTLGFKFFFAHSSVRLIRVIARHRHVDDRHLRHRLTFRHSRAPGRVAGDSLLHDIDIVSFEVLLFISA